MQKPVDWHYFRHEDLCKVDEDGNTVPGDAFRAYLERKQTTYPTAFDWWRKNKNNQLASRPKNFAIGAQSHRAPIIVDRPVQHGEFRELEPSEQCLKIATEFRVCTKMPDNFMEVQHAINSTSVKNRPTIATVTHVEVNGKKYIRELYQKAAPTNGTKKPNNAQVFAKSMKKYAQRFCALGKETPWMLMTCSANKHTYNVRFAGKVAGVERFEFIDEAGQVQEGFFWKNFQNVEDLLLNCNLHILKDNRE